MIVDRRMDPLFHPEEASPPDRATSLSLERVRPGLCVPLVAAWHSRLPHVQASPWRFAFAAHYELTVFAVALWHNPSARNLPQSWLELRRMAVADDAPHCTASWMLGAMRKWIKSNAPDVDRLISYQDKDVHTGTIYRAAGWDPAWEVKPRVRDRSKGLVKRSSYRTDANGASPASSPKTRWEIAP